MNFSPILVLVIIWIIIGVSGMMKQGKRQQTSRSAKNSPAGATASGKEPSAPKPAEPAKPAVMQPTITVTEHDDTIYQGSMNAETGEGFDPCHDEQLTPLTRAETAMPAADAETPGLQLNWTGSEIVRGIVMSEILKRK